MKNDASCTSNQIDDFSPRNPCQPLLRRETYTIHQLFQRFQISFFYSVYLLVAVSDVSINDSAAIIAFAIAGIVPDEGSAVIGLAHSGIVIKKGPTILRTAQADTVVHDSSTIGNCAKTDIVVNDS
ncbi:MAG: hypothetical protein HQ462_11900 [Deltaproteobacteria bacterium]|nr:hypothetical protein [Deltaproteobacteria bacterium]